MDRRNRKIFQLVSVIAILYPIVAGVPHQNCTEFSSIMEQVKLLVESENHFNSFLERIGCVTQSSIFGIVSYDKSLADKVEQSTILTVGAQVFKKRFNMSVNNFENLAKSCIKNQELFKHASNVHPKYRSIDGQGNNLKNPEWGASDTPFLRFGSKNYEDGINAIRKSVNEHQNLPNARLLVQELLSKVVRSPPPAMPFNLMALLFILFATHDLHYQVPIRYRKNEIGCCSKDSRNKLPPFLLNLACLPIEVSKNDSFYKHGNIGCLNMVRSQLGKYKCGVQTGQILNRATSYLDLSLIYGNVESELTPIRLHRGGKLRMGNKNVLPVDSNGKYLPSMNRFVLTPVASIWPALFTRNHNHLAERLAKLNSHWNDETVFQEARRINIAILQYNFMSTNTIERIFLKAINASYSDQVQVSTSLEFAVAYRTGHYYMPNAMVFQNENNSKTHYLLSDTIGKIKLLENMFDDAFRGAMDQPLNDRQFSEEIINRIGKNTDGYGVDLVAIDIQRGRDHGIPSFVEIRRKCKLTPEINSFDDFNKIFNKTNVELLKNIYKSHEDVDFYVGGLLELFENVGSPLVGQTFGCVILANYNNVMGGDIYFYSNPKNPYPFTKAQLDSIKKYSFSNLFCTNSGLKEINQLWAYVPLPINPRADCKKYPTMDLSAWKH